MILAIFAVICATAWLVTVAVPALLAAPLEAAVTALHRQIERSGSLARRIVPERWTGSISDAPLIGLLAAVLIFGLWAFFGILEDVVMGDPIVGLDTSVYARLQEVRTAPFDRLLVAITGLGDRSVVVPVALAGLVTLGLLGRWREAWYLMAAVAGAAVFVAGIKRVIHRPRPVAIYDGLAEYSFPSGHACMSVVLYGFLAFLVTRGAPPAWRRGIAWAALVLILLIAFSRVYLGAHWLSDVVAGLAFGAAWIALLALFYLRTGPPPVPAAALGVVLAVALAAAGTLHIMRDATAEAGRYGAPAGPVPSR